MGIRRGRFGIGGGNQNEFDLLLVAGTSQKMQSINGNSRIQGRPMNGRRGLQVSGTMAPERPRALNRSQSPSNQSQTSTSNRIDTPVGLHGRAVEEYATRVCIEQHQRYPKGLPIPKLSWNTNVLYDAYARCAEVTSEYAKTFYLGTQLMTPSQAKAIWAIYVWCRRTDELVDGPNANQITPEVRGD